MMRSRWLLLAMPASVGLALAMQSCLPTDSRPPPEQLNVLVQPSPDTSTGFTTPDGWTITFTRVLAGVGDVGLGGEACTDYAGDIGIDSQYDRLVDALAGKQKLAIVFGLGTCDVRVRMNSPDSNAVLGPTVSLEDLAFMRKTASDAFVDNQGAAVWLDGKAKKGSIEKTFQWAFRMRLQFRDCGKPADAGLTTELAMVGGETRELDVDLHAEELFRAENVDSAPLGFDAIAAADRNGDGVIELAELANVAVTDLDARLDAGIDSGDYDAGLIPDGGFDGGLPPFTTTLEDLVYNRLLARMIQVGDQVCVVGRRGRPG